MSTKNIYGKDDVSQSAGNHGNVNTKLTAAVLPLPDKVPCAHSHSDLDLWTTSIFIIFICLRSLL